MAEQRFEIYLREDGERDDPNRDSIALVFKEDGALVVDGVYTGPAAEAFWGDWDHEFQLRVPPEHARAFIAAVFRAAFNRERRLTFSQLQQVCRDEGIPAEESSWT